jgi:hypothetical protein
MRPRNASHGAPIAAESIGVPRIPSELAELLGVDEKDLRDYQLHLNIAPLQDHFVIRSRYEGDSSSWRAGSCEQLGHQEQLRHFLHRREGGNG